ncbi:hypothetical protein ACIBQ6_20540 [Nonomuraea sp. NPDC049655]|uniref:hypothetical protein n=1 Tax=Nonomuraea sp. NPDC049655 TaxID=3364355 RepID=UPI0037B4A138
MRQVESGGVRPAATARRAGRPWRRTAEAGRWTQRSHPRDDGAARRRRYRSN